MLLEKSNPLLANADRRAVMLPKLINSINLASEQDNLLPVYVKNANLWLQARENSYITAKDWEKATDYRYGEPKQPSAAQRLPARRNLEIQQAQGKIQRHEQCGR